MVDQRFSMPMFTSLIVRNANKVLLLKRNKNKICGGYYAFPGGGVDGNEPVTVATVREAFEEIGITVQANDLHFVHVYHFSRQGDIEYVNFFFQITSWQGLIENKEPDKCDEVVWFDFDNLPINMLPGHRHVLTMLENQNKFSIFGWTEKIQ